MTDETAIALRPVNPEKKTLAMPLSVRRMAMLNASLKGWLAHSILSLRFAPHSPLRCLRAQPFECRVSFQTERASFCPWNFSRDGDDALLCGGQYLLEIRALTPKPAQLNATASSPFDQSRNLEMSTRRYRELAQQATGRRSSFQKTATGRLRNKIGMLSKQRFPNCSGFSLL